MNPEPFRIAVEEPVLEDLKYRLKHTRWPSALDSGWQLGTKLAYLKDLAAYWQSGYDWRAQEAHLNRLPHFRCQVDGIDIHFIHQRGNGPQPMPIILTHGWPDSFLRYAKLIPLLADPGRHGGDPADAFDVVVPSVPGFGFSGMPAQGGMNNRGIAALWAKLMTSVLGYQRFAAGGGDVGSGVTRFLALDRPDLLVGIHLTDLGVLRPLLAGPEAGLTEAELRYRKEAQHWIASESAYNAIQSTKPQTLSFGLADSPVGLAAWILEKFCSWSACRGDLARGLISREELLTNIMIYWVSGTAGTAARLYHENASMPPTLGPFHVPLAVAIYPDDVLVPPREWAQRNLTITRWTEMPRGGHFTAMEDPQPLAEDIRAFFRSLRKGMGA